MPDAPRPPEVGETISIRMPLDVGNGSMISGAEYDAAVGRAVVLEMHGYSARWYAEILGVAREMPYLNLHAAALLLTVRRVADEELAR